LPQRKPHSPPCRERVQHELASGNALNEGKISLIFLMEERLSKIPQGELSRR